MLISREELSFDFKKASFDTSLEFDRKFLAWVFDQFLYGEVTGIHCGHWLYHAPHLHGATFLCKQATEEIAHVRKILRIFSLLGEKPNSSHPAIRFLSTGMMGGTWGEHVTLEMALGEGLVLTAFYALADTITHPEIHRIIESTAKDEERHVAFGETETLAWLAKHPGDRKLLLGLALFQVLAMKRLKNFIGKKLSGPEYAGHPVLSQFPQFYDHTLNEFEKRIERLGLYQGSLQKMSLGNKIKILSALPFRIARNKLKRPQKLLTSTYLQDPMVLLESQKALPHEAQ